MTLLAELALIFGRIVTILPLLLATTLLMGKRSIGEVPIFDFLIIITLASVTGADIADPSVSHIHTAFAIVAIGLLQKAVARLVIKKRTFGKWITFEPTVVVKDGKLIIENIKSISYSIDYILQMLREKNIFAIEDVEIAIVEGNGRLSVKPRVEQALPTVADLGLQPTNERISYPVIMEGRIQKEVLEDLRITVEELRQKLQQKGVLRLESVFLCTMNQAKELHLAYTERDERIERIQH
ncbi:DUF421 domain-containing protein [Alkalihalobacillus oceani]|uniref:YetF domain-containing protein n=1 Tax=Halalkalibacter oceani TaxID=1653776 RepID=UPI002040E0D2|nr:DUF421 domain-containing protein [Halalkalibacter oceani]MCM3762933.1 DUF421 domain-containing protein [Halalkalibacter oceani]